MKRLVGLAIVLVLAVACGGNGTGAGGHDHAHQHTSEGSVPGNAADRADADREIKIVTTDELRFEPDSIQVEEGEIITFVVQNKGDANHEFVLGDADYQHAHAEEMHDEGMMGESENALTLKPGETKELTWEFSEAGEVLYGCHVAGHYDGGMVGTIEVS